MKLYLDTETYSSEPISHGVYRYAQDSMIMIIQYAVDEGPVVVSDLTDPKDTRKVAGFKKALREADEIIAHYANFDRVMLERHGWIGPLDPRWRCTMARALLHGLPGGLLILSALFKLPIDKAKDKEGHSLIQLFCKPDKEGNRATRQTHPEQWKKFLEYARLDIEAERALDKKLPAWSCTPTEQEIWDLDQKVNDRGFQIDLDLVQAAVVAVDKEKHTRNKEIQSATDGQVQTVQQRDALLNHIREEYGVKLPDMKASTLERRLNDDELSEGVKELIRARLVGAGTAVSKYKAMMRCVCSDGRIRGGLQYSGASRTQRWSGRLVQPQNYARPTHKKAEVERGITAIKSGCAHLIYDSVSSIASSALRGSIIAPEGRKLVVADLSSIEGRMVAYLAGEEYKLEDYRAYDRGDGFDAYVTTYAHTFGLKPAEVTKAQRQEGKVVELFGQYGGGAGAFKTFSNTYGIDLEDLANRMLDKLPAQHKYAAARFYDRCKAEKRSVHGMSKRVFVTCDTIKRMWREKNPNIVQFWYDLEKAVIKVLRGVETEVRLRKLVVSKYKNWLKIKLPSGRYISYASARVDGNGIVYRGVDSHTKKWQDIRTWGGKLVENTTQAAARDCFAHGMLIAEQEGYEMILTVHDEMLTETPDSPKYNIGRLCEIMSIPPSWAPELPLGADGFESHRYRKD